MRASRHGRPVHRVRKLIAAAVAAVALGAGAFAMTAQASEDAPTTKYRVPKGYTVVSEPSAQQRIIGGTDTTFSKAPYMVQLLYDVYGDGDMYFNCGGTLVAPNKVLTAAHCIRPSSAETYNYPAKGLILGGTAKVAGGPNGEGTTANVSRVWIHPGWNPDAGSQNDIAVMTLSKPLPYATLPMAGPEDAASYAPGTQGIALGWGLTSGTGNELASTLQQVTLPLNADSVCQENLGEFGYTSNGTMMCVGQPGTGSDATGKTTCPGDSGGPLIVRGKVVGVVSWGVGSDFEQCNMQGYYEAFTKVSTYKGLAQGRVDDTDLSRDGRADLFARTSAGVDYSFNSNGVGFAGKYAVSGSYSGYNLVVQTDLNQDGLQDFVARKTSNGELYWIRRTLSSTTYSAVRIATGYGSYRAILAPGDVTGDRKPDVVGVSSSGVPVVLPGNGNGTVGTAKVVGSGYSRFNAVRGHGDFTNDGRTDLVARESSSGALYLIPGTGSASAPFGTPVRVAEGWSSYNAIASLGDVSGDGIADLVTRKSDGTLQLHRGTGQSGTGMLRAPIQAGTGFGGFNLFG